MKKKRNTAIFVRILRATLCALVLVFTLNFAHATEIYDGNSKLECSFDNDNVTFVAKFCKNCTSDSLETTNCQLIVEDGQCVYSAQCLPGYDPDSFDDSDPANPSCEPCANSANVATWGNNCQILTCDDGYTNINNACVFVNIAISYDCGTGNGVPPTSGLATYGAILSNSLARNAGTCTKQNMGFAGWLCENADGAIDNELVYNSTKDITCYAQWDSGIYDIVYHLNGGEFKTSDYPQSYVYGTGVSVLKSPYKFGLDFGGWYDNAELEGEPVANISSDTYGTKHLYAKWNFECESGKWLHIGDDNNDKFCLYESKPAAPAMVVETKQGKFYMILTKDSNIPVHTGSNKKMRVEIGGHIYNVHDASVDAN